MTKFNVIYSILSGDVIFILMCNYLKCLFYIPLNFAHPTTSFSLQLKKSIFFFLNVFFILQNETQTAKDFVKIMDAAENEYQVGENVSIHSFEETKGCKITCQTNPISLPVLPPPSTLLFFSDCHQRELPGHVGHYLQSLTPPASCDTYQDRLEQDPELQDWQGDAERLKKKKKIIYIDGEHNRQPPHPLPNNVA